MQQRLSIIAIIKYELDYDDSPLMIVQPPDGTPVLLPILYTAGLHCSTYEREIKMRRQTCCTAPKNVNLIIIYGQIGTIKKENIGKIDTT